jgi:hypothetical protein
MIAMHHFGMPLADLKITGDMNIRRCREAETHIVPGQRKTPLPKGSGAFF